MKGKLIEIENVWKVVIQKGDKFKYLTLKEQTGDYESGKDVIFEVEGDLAIINNKTESPNQLALIRGELICRNSQFCKGKQVGVHGRMFGADLMEELDASCAVFAAEICDTPWVVTKTMNIEFISAVLPNQIYKTYIGIKKIGRTSITLNVEIRKHSVHTEKETLAVKAETVFVRINEEGEAINISDSVRKKFGYDIIG